MYHHNYALINLDNIVKNVNTLIKRYSNYQYYFGVVRADAYGHGAIKVSQEIIKQGVNYLIVSSLDEALEIRDKMKYVSILCSTPVSLEYINVAIKNNITITISSYEYYQELIKKNLKGELKAHLEIDTGINCFGVKEKKEIEEIVKGLLDHKKILLEGLCTTLADADNIDSTFFDEQINKLLVLTKDIELDAIPIIHVYNSAALLSHPKLKMANGVRLGICMYGINPIKHKHIDIKLLPTFALYSEIIEKKYVKENEYIGYSNSFKAKSNMTLGIVPIGYKDGFSPLNTGRNVSINGSRYKIIDGVYMDTMTIYINEGVSVYDKVVLIGEIVPIEEVAEYTNSNEYEIMTAISAKIPRKYIKNGKQVQ